MEIAMSTEYAQVDIVKHVTTCIYNDIIFRWVDREIGCGEYRDHVKRLYKHHMYDSFSLTWTKDHGQMNNHLGSVFTRLNRKIRAKQRYEKCRKEKELLEMIAEDEKQRRLDDFYAMAIEANHDICPIDGYPVLDFTD
jgi:hypothetical protein